MLRKLLTPLVALAVVATVGGHAHAYLLTPAR